MTPFMNIASVAIRNIHRTRYNNCSHTRWSLYKGPKEADNERWQCEGCRVIATHEALLKLLLP
jgi:hypothetical protein